MAGSRTPGVYLLLIHLRRGLDLHIRGGTRLGPGWYVCVGSAMGGLEARLARHFRTKHPRHWHVDWLLAGGRVADAQVVFTRGPEAECRLADAVSKWPEATRLPGFGASDCSCASHLCRFAHRPGVSLLAPALLEHVDALYAELARHYENHATHARDPFRTLVSCILSLRTQDPVTDAARERLFARIHTVQELAAEWLHDVPGAPSHPSLRFPTAPDTGRPARQG